MPDLTSLRSFTDPGLAISERFIRLDLAGVPTLGVVSTPMSPSHDLGWLICHSYGTEQTNLLPLEVDLARALSAAGFPVLRFQARGYGDNLAPLDDVGVASHLEDCAMAVESLRRIEGVRRIGLIGVRFGGALAALTAIRAKAFAIVLVDPVVTGDIYAQKLMRAGLAAELVGKGRLGQARDPLVVLEEEGGLGVDGFPLTPRAYRELSSMDLIESLSEFGGRALILGVARSPTMPAPLQSLEAKLRELGGLVDTTVIAHQEANRFGLPRFRRARVGMKIDTQAGLSQEVILRTLRWIHQLIQGGGDDR